MLKMAAISSFLMILLASLIYYFYFSDYIISDNPEHWGWLGDYFGGVLNPLLSFVSIVLIVMSLRLQGEANEGLKKELENSRLAEDNRVFENKFFRMIDSLASSFTSFRVDVPCENSSDGYRSIYGAEAAIAVEGNVEFLLEMGASGESVSEYLWRVDERDQLFSMVRSFYVTVKFIVESGDSSRVPSSLDTLISFTDFSLLRILVICSNFCDYYSANYLYNSEEFRMSLERLGFDLSSYDVIDS